METLRYYERRGLIEPRRRTDAGYHVYDAGVELRPQYIRRSQALGFSLDEIAELLALSGQPESSAAEVKQLIQAKIDDIESRIRDLQRMRSVLVELECQCPGDAGSNAECPMLAALSQGD